MLGDEHAYVSLVEAGINPAGAAENESLETICFLKVVELICALLLGLAVGGGAGSMLLFMFVFLLAPL